INHIIKLRARRYIAAGSKDWLFPEQSLSTGWSDNRELLRPPKDHTYLFGGEMYAKFESGHVHYQDAFGRTEKPRDFLLKTPTTQRLRPGDVCGCGSGRRFKHCCDQKPTALRPSWIELSIRERNLAL